MRLLRLLRGCFRKKVTIDKGDYIKVKKLSTLRLYLMPILCIAYRTGQFYNLFLNDNFMYYCFAYIMIYEKLTEKLTA